MFTSTYHSPFVQGEPYVPVNKLLCPLSPISARYLAASTSTSTSAPLGNFFTATAERAGNG